ncbi:MAG: MFS transporter [Beggiatoa sp. IS2]|nr:MAG: MFS transporter [Beggiatoa sp. IS2]
MLGLIDVSIRNARTVLTILAFILITGIIAYQDMPKESEPDVAIPIMYVSLFYEGISPEDAERLLVRPMEKELRTIEGVKEMTATAAEGHASVMLEFDAGFNSEKALRNVIQKVDVAKAKLPAGTEEPVVNEVNVALFPILVITLAGDVPERTLLRLARNLKDAVESVPEVLKVDIAGNREEVIEIVIDPLRLESYQLSYEEVFQFFNRNNQLVAAGALDTGQGRFNVKVPGVFETLEDVLSLPVKMVGQRVVTIKDVADIHRTFKDPTSYARVNGKPAIALEISKRVGTNLILTVEKIRVVVAQLKKDWPQTLQINFLQDRSKEIRTMLNDLQNNVLAAVFLVAVVIIASLGLRSALLAMIAVPGSFLLGILTLQAMGLTMNMVVLFSLILASGMLVDGTVIVTEFADRRMSEGMPKVQAYSLAAKRMFWPIIGSTLTTIAVFIPLLFWPGILGEFMKFLPITVIATLTASLLMALIFLPTLGALVGKPSPAETANYDDAELSAVRGITGVYIRFLGVLLHYPLLILLLGLLSLIGAWVGYIQYGRGVEFFPSVEPEQIMVNVRTRGDLSIQEQDALVREVETRILSMQEFASVYANSGIISRQQDTPEDTIGVIQIELIDWQRRRLAKEIFEEIRQRTKNIAGIMIEIRKPPSGPGESKPIRLEVNALDTSLLNSATAELVAGLEKITGLLDIEDNRALPGIDWKMAVDRKQASRFGADISSVGYAVQLVTNGIKVGEYRPDDADEELDIRIRFPADYRNIERLDLLRLKTAAGLVPISLFVQRVPQQRIGILRRTEERRILTVKSAVQEGVLVNDKLQEIRTWLANLPKTSLLADSRIILTFKGEDEDQREAQEFLSRAFVVAVFLVAIILIAQFDSFYQTLLILTAVILSTIGVLVGLLVMHQPFGIVMNGIGIIALAGVVVNNNIVLIDTFNILRSEGLDRYEAVLRTCAQRLRPVFLTTITAILGLIPMVLGISIDFVTREISIGAPSTQWWIQLSTSIAFGLAFATVLTLVLTPCLLMLDLAKIPRWFGSFFRKVFARLKVLS